VVYAAIRSIESGGRYVKISEIMDQARAEVRGEHTCAA
jgi:hypothetical protein